MYSDRTSGKGSEGCSDRSEPHPGQHPKTTATRSERLSTAKLRAGGKPRHPARTTPAGTPETPRPPAATALRTAPETQRQPGRNGCPQRNCAWAENPAIQQVRLRSSIPKATIWPERHPGQHPKHFTNTLATASGDGKPRKTDGRTAPAKPNEPPAIQTETPRTRKMRSPRALHFLFTICSLNAGEGICVSGELYLHLFRCKVPRRRLPTRDQKGTPVRIRGYSRSCKLRLRSALS